MKLRNCFILGCSGSGKSILAGALRCLDGTLFANEIILPTCLAHLVNQPIDPSIRQLLARGIANHFDSFVASGETTSRANAGLQFMRREISFAEFRRALKGARTFDLFLFESNFYSFAPELLAEAFPEALWLFVVRDGRDCADVLVDNYDVFSDERIAVLTNPEMPVGRKVDDRYVPWWVEQGREKEFLDSSPFGRAAWMWKVSAKRCHDFFQQMQRDAPNRAKLVRYRELVQNPLAAGHELSAWFGKSLNRPAARRLRMFHTDHIGNYKDRTQVEISEAERIAGTELRLLGFC